MTPITTLGFVAGENLDDRLFTPEQLLSAETLISQFLSDRSPTLELSQISTLYDTHVRPGGLVYLISRDQLESFKDTMSLQGVLDNPEVASDEVVDAILSNLLIFRKQGAFATGRAKITVSSKSTYTIPSGGIFETSTGVQFKTTQGWVVNENPTDENQLKLYPGDTAGTQYYFLLPLQAVVEGVSGQISDLTELVPTFNIPRLIISVAFGSFIGGIDKETNEALIKRALPALSVRNLTSRSSIFQRLKDEFTDLEGVTIQGMADPCMTRDSGNILGVSAGGFVDVYVRTSQGPTKGTAEITATKQSTTGANVATYSLIVDRDILPGAWFASAIYPKSSGVLSTYRILTQVKSFDTRMDENGLPLGSQHPNKVYTVLEAGYSRYQYTTITFEVNPPNDGYVHPTTLEVTVELFYQPHVAEIQDLVNDSQEKVVAADYLVKSVVPCLVAVTPITVRAATGVITSDKVRTAIYNLINQTQLGQSIHLDDLIQTIKNIDGVRYLQLPLTLSGTIRCPDANGTTLEIISDTDLVIPDRPDLQVTPNTTGFFVDMDSIEVAIIEIV